MEARGQEWSKSSPAVPARATQGAEARRAIQWWWAEASVWTERMVSALVNGVKGGKWFSLMDKVYPRRRRWRRPGRKSRANEGAAGWTARASSGSRRRRSCI